MTCPQCRQDNPAEARFCNGCGSRLALTCPVCNQPNPPGSRFCNGCGQKLGETPAPAPGFTEPRGYTPTHLAEKILGSRSALEGERKQVTVLFVDASGFTSLSERLDPEDVHGMMTRVFELILAEVHRYEGTVNQFLGDGVMALPAVAGGLVMTGMVHGITARHDQAQGELDRALAISRDAGILSLQGLALHVMGNMRNWHGRHQEALELATEGVQVAREHPQFVSVLTRCLWTHGVDEPG